MSVVGFALVLGLNDLLARAHFALGCGLLIGFILRQPVRALAGAPAVRRAGARRSSQPGEAPLHLDGEPRDAHAAERHHRHVRPAARHAAQPRAGRHAADAAQLLARACSAWSTMCSTSRRSRPARCAIEQRRLRPARARQQHLPHRRGAGRGKGLDFVVSIMPEVPPAAARRSAPPAPGAINLLGNAVKFTERGSVTVHVSVAGRDRAAVRAEILDPRHRHRHRAGSAGTHLRELHAGRPVDHAPLRRHGPRHHHRQAAGRADGRRSVSKARSASAARSGSSSSSRSSPSTPTAASGELAGARVLLVGFPAAERGALGEALAGWGALPVSTAATSKMASRAWSPRSVSPSPITARCSTPPART